MFLNNIFDSTCVIFVLLIPELHIREFQKRFINKTSNVKHILLIHRFHAKLFNTYFLPCSYACFCRRQVKG